MNKVAVIAFLITSIKYSLSDTLIACPQDEKRENMEISYKFSRYKFQSEFKSDEDLSINTV